MPWPSIRRATLSRTSGKSQALPLPNTAERSGRRKQRNSCNCICGRAFPEGFLQALRPGLQRAGIRTLKKFCVHYGSSFHIGLELYGRFSDPASAGCGKGSHFFTGKVVGLAEVVHYAGSDAVPDREADKDRVIAFKVFRIARKGNFFFFRISLCCSGKED